MFLRIPQIGDLGGRWIGGLLRRRGRSATAGAAQEGRQSRGVATPMCGPRISASTGQPRTIQPAAGASAVESIRRRLSGITSATHAGHSSRSPAHPCPSAARRAASRPGQCRCPAPEKRRRHPEQRIVQHGLGSCHKSSTGIASGGRLPMATCRLACRRWSTILSAAATSEGWWLPLVPPGTPTTQQRWRNCRSM